MKRFLTAIAALVLLTSAAYATIPVVPYPTSVQEMKGREQRNYAKDEIEAFKADPMKGEINSVVNKIYMEIGKNSMTNATTHETNNVDEGNNDADIFGEINACTSKNNTESVDIFAPIL